MKFTKYENQKTKTFAPWIGENYKEGGLLIVAESNYGGWEWEKHEEDINKFIIQERINGFSQSFHTNIYNLVKEYLKVETVKEFWNKVCFTNYLQVVLESPEEREISHFYIHDDIFKRHFLNQIKQLKLKYVLVFSKRIGKLLEYNGIEEFCNKEKICFKTTMHPSRMFFKKEMEHNIKDLFSNSL